MGKRILASANEWVLFDTGKGADGWRDLKLESRRRGKIPKRNWWFGFNGDRLSGSRDAKLLEEHQPAALRWVLAVLKT